MLDYVHACIHTYIQTYIHTYMHACTRTHIHRYEHSFCCGYHQLCFIIHSTMYIHTYIHTYKHTNIHTCTHTYTQTNKQTQLLLRLSPIVPYNALNYCLAVMPLDFIPFMLASFIGMMPGGLLYVYIGSTAASISDAAGGNTKQTPLQQVCLCHTCVCYVYSGSTAAST